MVEIELPVRILLQWKPINLILTVTQKFLELMNFCQKQVTLSNPARTKFPQSFFGLGASDFRSQWCHHDPIWEENTSLHNTMSAGQTREAHTSYLAIFLLVLLLCSIDMKVHTCTEVRKELEATGALDC